MNQRTHTWLAIRALALMDDLGTAPDLIKILRPNVRSTAIGAWIPDLQDARLGFGDVDNHIFKLKPYRGREGWRFTEKKKKLMKKLGAKRNMYWYIKNDETLNDSWWKRPYKADPQPGQHLANRSMALSMALIDQLILGDPKVAKLVPRKVRFASNLDDEARSTKQQISTYFFMLSHFIADSCMPCHCDARTLAAYNNGLHKELERHWSKKVGTYFEKKNILESTVSSRTILKRAKEIDDEFDIKFPNAIPDLKEKDVWREIVNVCRGSFAIASVIAPPGDYPYNKKRRAPFEKLFGGKDGEIELEDLDWAVMHDAVLNIAIVWKHIWEKF